MDPNDTPEFSLYCSGSLYTTTYCSIGPYLRFDCRSLHMTGLYWFHHRVYAEIETLSVCSVPALGSYAIVLDNPRNFGTYHLEANS